MFSNERKKKSGHDKLFYETVNFINELERDDVKGRIYLTMSGG